MTAIKADGKKFTMGKLENGESWKLFYPVRYYYEKCTEHFFRTPPGKARADLAWADSDLDVIHAAIKTKKESTEAHFIMGSEE